MPIKSEGYSRVLRDLGNQEFQQKNYFDALKYYNMSLSFAISDQNLAYGYSNRSAVYLELKLYELCVDNIRAAKHHKYPLTKIHKLTKRVDECMANIPEVIQPSKKTLFFQPSYRLDPKTPNIVDCLELRKDQKYGQGIFTTSDLNPGDMLCIEEPVMIKNDENERYVRCSQCLNCNFMSLMPCKDSASFMFCSQDCQNSFVNSPNETFDMTKVGGDSLVTQFLDYDTDSTIFDFDFSNKKDPDYKKNQMKCVVTWAKKLPDNLETSNATIEDFSSTEDFFNVRQKILANSYKNRIVEYAKKGYRYSMNAGDMVFAFFPLINHACYSNVDNVIINNRSILYVTKIIKAGEQLFYSYLHDEKIMKNVTIKFEKRQQYLIEMRGFKCECYYCLNKINFRMLESGLDNDVVKAIIDSYKLERTVEITSPEEMMNQLKENWGLISKHCKNPRSLDVELLESVNRSIISDLAQALTYPCIRMHNT